MTTVGLHSVPVDALLLAHITSALVSMTNQARPGSEDAFQTFSPSPSSSSLAGGEPFGPLLPYNPCDHCRGEESTERVVHAVNAFRPLELPPQRYCDERRPTCRRCEASGRRLCSYPLPGETTSFTLREHQLRHQLDGRTRDLNVALRLLRLLRHAGDQDATTALARLRLSNELWRLIAALNEGDTSGLMYILAEPAILGRSPGADIPAQITRRRQFVGGPS